jgi:calcium-dependent protein kinase
MLVKPEKRPSSGQVLQHAWFQEKNSKEDKSLKLNFQALKSFRNAERLKKVALTFIASQLSESEILELNALFNKLDKNGDGVLTLEELKAGLGEVNEKSAKEFKGIMDSMDTDKSGTINYTGRSNMLEILND